MADKKISALTSATTPLAGTEVLPIVQGGSTVKVPVSDLTAGRNVAVGAAVGVPRTLSVGGSVALERYGATPTVALRGGTDNTVGYEYRQNIVQSQGLSFSTATIGGSQVEYWFFQPNGDFRVAGSNVVIGTAGKGIDASGSPVTVANSGTFDFPNFSGYIYVCNHTTGSLATFGCGAAATGAFATLWTSYGALAYNAGINGYTWTNDTGSSADFTFSTLRLRPNA